MTIPETIATDEAAVKTIVVADLADVAPIVARDELTFVQFVKEHRAQFIAGTLFCITLAIAYFATRHHV
jgi:hypothetical protein